TQADLGMDIDVETLLTLLLGAGGAGFLSALFSGIRSLQRGVAGRTREGIADLARWRDEANDARERAERSRDARRMYAAQLEYQILSSGGTLPPGVTRPED